MTDRDILSQGVYTKEQGVSFSGPIGQLEGLTFGLGLEDDVQPNVIGVICHPHPLFQGSMNNKVVSIIAKAWQALGLPTVKFNFRGVGRSEGSYGNAVGEIEDLKAVLTELQQSYPKAHFWLAGFSFGSFIALSVASERLFPVEAVLTIAPPVHHLAYSTLEPPACPWLVIQGLLDTVVPVNEALTWIEALKKKHSNIELVTLANASHFFHGQLMEVKHIIYDKMINYK